MGKIIFAIITMAIISIWMGVVALGIFALLDRVASKVVKKRKRK